MDQDFGLTAVEQHVIERSADSASTRRRIRLSLITAALLVAAVVSAAWATRSWRLLAGVFVAHVVVTTWERVAYGRSVLVYKAVVRKLHEELLGARGGGA